MSKVIKRASLKQVFLEFTVCFLPFIAEVLDCKITKVQALADKQPTTVIRETDSFLLLETDSATEPKFILHLEFESGDDPEMIYRMSEHHGIELRNLEELTINISEEMPIHIDIEKDYLYKLGWQKASEQLAKVEAEVKKAGISKMLKANISLEQMADFLGMSTQEVKVYIAEIKQAETD